MKLKHITVGLFFIGLCVFLFVYFASKKYTVSQVQTLTITLQKLEDYSKGLEEYPEPDTKRYLKQDYTSFFKRTTPTNKQRFRERIFAYFGMDTKWIWLPELFLELLTRVENDRKKLWHSGDFIVRLIPKAGSRIVVFGDIQGAFHSLIRDLRKLNELGILDENLKITSSDDYFVFNGDIISRSPYSLETLVVALKLIEENPNRVFYIRGNHEMFNYWYGFGMKKELKFKAAHISNQSVPLEKEINAFFATLPLGVYIGIPPGVIRDFIKITHLDSSDFPKLHHENYSGFLEANKEEHLKVIDLDNIKKSKDPISIKVRIIGLSREFTYEENDGLKLLPAKRGATTWTLMSCPTLAYQKEFDFHYDAFGIVTVGLSFSRWTIDLYNQDVRKKDGFKQKRYNLITGRVEDNYEN